MMLKGREALIMMQCVLTAVYNKDVNNGMNGELKQGLASSPGLYFVKKIQSWGRG